MMNTNEDDGPHECPHCGGQGEIMVCCGDLKGVVCYGTPSSAPLRRGLAGVENASNVVELTRLWVCDSVPRNGESFLIGRTVGKAGKEIVVSFAEIQQGYLGIVYQATNWIYTGLSAKRTNWAIAGVDKHCQTLADKYTATEIREKYGDRFSLQERPRKHRYVFINASKVSGGRRPSDCTGLLYVSATTENKKWQSKFWCQSAGARTAKRR